MKRLKIGLSACFFHADPLRPIFKGKTLQYLEQSLAHWVMSEGALVYLIPAPSSPAPYPLSELVQDFDGLVLQGGSDVSPSSYGETALKPEWGGDAIRDRYEISLLQEFRAQGKPILGICRGLQLVNVAFGGTLYQDIATQAKTPIDHRCWEIYDQNHHTIAIEKGSGLENLYGTGVKKVNTIHHQAIRDLGKGLAVEARAPDGIIEAVRAVEGPSLFAVQWHPEFHDPKESELMDGKPFLRQFLEEARRK